MKATEDRLAVARAVRWACGAVTLSDDEMLKFLMALPEPPDDSPATLPAPPGIGVCCMCDAEIPIACKGCLDYARESVGLPAPDVQALDTRPPCNCPRDYAQYLGDDPHNRWCPRSRNPHPEVIQAQIDAARADEREACAQVADGERVADCNERTALCIAIAAKIRARSGARGV